MADIFVSYSRADKPRVAPLVKALEAKGWSVWWDTELSTGEEFDQVTAKELDRVKAVVVVWTPTSVASRWVRGEARVGADRGVLVPVRFDNAQMPIDVRAIHTTDLDGWDGNPESPAFKKLAQSLAAMMKADGASATAPAAMAPVAPAKAAFPVPPKFLIAGAGVIALILIVTASILAFGHSRSGMQAPLTQVAASKAATPVIAPAAVAISDKSIAVLPFADMSEKKDQEYFSDGLTEELIDLIAKVPDLRVTARTSSFYFKGKQVTIAEIAKALNVANLLEGSVRKSGNTLRIAVQLVRADNGYNLWSEIYDRKLDDIFKVQDDIAGAVVKALKISLLEGSAPHATPATNTEAYTLYLQGRAFTERYTREDNQKATQYLRQSIKLDPNFAPAWSSLAISLSTGFGLFGSVTDYAKYESEVKAATARVLALDPNSAFGHSLSAFRLWTMDQDLAGAEREYRMALKLDASRTTASLAGFFFLSQGEMEEALTLGRSAIVADPLSMESYRLLGTALYFNGNLDEAEKTFRKALEINPAAEGLHARIGLVLLARNQPEAALKETQAEPNPGRRQTALALALDAMGRRAEADQALGDVKALGDGGWSYQVAQVYAHRKDFDKAFAWLQTAYDQHDGGIFNYLKVDPLLEPLRSDPRYEALVQKSTSLR